MILVAVALAVGVPVWPMYNSNPFGTRASPTAGYYNEGDVPSVQGSCTVSVGNDSVTDSVVGAGGDVYLAAGRRVMRVGSWTAEAGKPCTSLVLPSVANTVFALCGDAVEQFETLGGTSASKWSIATNLTNTFRPLLIDVLNGLLIITSDTDKACAIEARSLASGFLVWLYQGTAPSTTTPVLTGDAIVLHTTDGKLRLISPRFGTETTSLPTSISSQVSLQYCSREEYVLVSGGSASLAVSVFHATDTTLANVWSQTFSIPMPAYVLVLVPGSLEIFGKGTIVTVELETGIQTNAQQLKYFGLVGSGLIDSQGTVYGAIDGMVTTRTKDAVEWCYKPLNCSGAETLLGTPRSLVGGKDGFVTLVLESEGLVTVSQIGSEAYPQCSTLEKCSCVGELGPRSCAWCDTSSICIEVGPANTPVYGTCASINMDPCNKTSPTPPPAPTPPPPGPTPGTPAGLEGVWRGVQLQTSAQSVEWGYYLTSTALYLTYPNGTTADYTTSSAGPNTLYYDTDQGTVKCSWLTVPNLPQTKQATMACGAPGADMPVSLSVALCSRKNESVIFLVSCLIPAVQHPVCEFPPPPNAITFTNMCGDACTHFDDCPTVCFSKWQERKQECSCQVASNDLTCCGGVCPSPTPGPAPAPTPPPGPSPAPPSDVCRKSCSSDSTCSSPSGLCSICVNNTCGSLCGGACAESADCRSASCPFCNAVGQCQREPVPCLSECMSNADCGEECPTCFAVSPNPGKCGANCGQNCTSDDQCLGSGACSHCTGGTCGAVPPPGDKYICSVNMCVANNTGYTGNVCNTVCDTLPSGSTPGGIIGTWAGVDVKQGFASGDWLFDFESTSVTVYRNALFQWSARVMTHGPGLFFLFTAPSSLASQNATALFAIAQTNAASPVRVLDIAIAGLGQPLPYDFQGPMVGGFGQFVLVDLFNK